MNPKWFGDSFDIVKRFFIENLNDIGYRVVVNPMLTEKLDNLEEKYYKLLKAHHINEKNNQKSALFFDPDTGVGKKKTTKHITIKCIADELKNYDIVFSFDQSFSRCENPADKINEKLKMLQETGNFGMYYDSHARFLFAAKSDEIIREFKNKLLSSGLPKSRLLEYEQA